VHAAYTFHTWKKHEEMGYRMKKVKKFIGFRYGIANLTKTFNGILILKYGGIGNERN